MLIETLSNNIKLLDFSFKTENTILVEKTETAEMKITKIEDEEINKKQYTEEKENKSTNVWQIEIPKIDLIAPISEGTSTEVMNKYVGHFESTEVWNGNVGLAAHNRRISCELFCSNQGIKNRR